MSYKSLAQRILSALMFSLVLLVMSFGVVWAEEPQVFDESQLASFAGTVQLVTKGADGNGVYAAHNTRCCGMSDDGSFLFISNAQNLVAPPTALVENRLYLFDNATKVITLLPKFGDLAPQTAQIAADKTWIVVQTTTETVFIYNTITFELFPVVKSDGTQITNIDWFDSNVDASVVALSTMLKLDPADTNSKYDLYLWSRATKATQLVSKKGDGTAAGIERPVEISQDSGFVSYIGAGSNFPACGTKAEDIYRRNVSTDEITCVTEGITDNYEEFFNSFQMSTDGNVFLFNGLKYVGVNPESTNLYLVDLRNGTTAATLFDTVEFDKLNFYKLSADGSTVVYTRGAFNTPATPKEYCTYAVATATHSCIAAPTGVRDGDFGMISPTARYTIISAWDHQWIGSTVENKKNQAYHDDLFIWDKEGVNNTISGHVTGDDGVTGLPGVMLTNGTGEQYVTDATGQYSMPYLTAAQLYEVTPSMSGKTFYPASKLVTVPTSGSVDFSTRDPVTVVESGFRLNEHAWNFPNRAFVPEQKHIVGAFGEDNARKFAGVVFSDGTAGSCFGYVVTASLLVHGTSLGLTPPVTPFVNTFSVPDPGENIVNEDPYFQPSAVADYIVQSHYRQFSIEYSYDGAQSRLMSLNGKINAIKQSVDDKFNSNPVIIGLQNRSNDCGGHAVVPISYTVLLDGRTEVGVYDPNHPVGMNEHQTIIFDESNQSWSYMPRGENVSFGSDVVCTNANNQLLKSEILVLHAKTYSKPTNPPWWQMPVGNFWIEVSNWVVSVRDAAGNVLGDVGGEIVENIPNSFVFTPLDQLGGNPKSWYVVQADTTITATIQYNNSTDDAVTLFAHKAIFDVGLAESGVTTDTFVIDSSGDAVSLFGGGSRSITTTRLLTDTEQIFTLGMQESDQVRVQVFDDGSLKFFTTTAQEVTLILEQDGESGNEQYQLSLPPFAAGDAQIITPHWQEHSATISIDVGNDGTIDNTVTVQEETHPQPAVIYLPIVVR